MTNAASSSRWMCGVWLDIQIVYSSVPGLYEPMSPRTSIGLGMRRWLTIRCRTTTSAPSHGRIRAGLVADVPLEDDVVRRVLVELRGAWRDRLLGVHDGRQRFPVHHDGIERIERLVLGFGDDGRDALAGPLDAVRGERPRACSRCSGSRRCRPPARPSASGCTGCRRRRRRPRPRASPSPQRCRSSGCSRGRTGCGGWPCGPSTGA